MTTWTPADHPRATNGEFTAKPRTEPKATLDAGTGGELEAEPLVSVQHTHPDGTVEWRTRDDNKLHRTDGPAAVYPGGDEAWYFDGEMHRVNGPAMISTNGLQVWYFHGQRHRTDGPAVIHRGFESWYLHDKLHRVDGPAFSERNGAEDWRLHGELHRVGGPARTSREGKLEWWEKGVRRPPEVEEVLTMLWNARTP